MIELTTGVVFLMSSLYGAGQHGYNEAAVGNVPTESDKTEQADMIESGSSKNQKEIEAFLRKEFADTPILVEIARCESTFRHFDDEGKVVRGRIDKRDTGVMQINLYYHGDTAKKLNIDLYSLDGNVAYAKYLYGKYGSQPWSASAPCWGSSELARN
jgi:hypothetical protein